MRGFLLASNLVVVLSSVGILAATFTARDYIEESARATLLAQAQHVTTPWVDKTETALHSPLASRLLNEDQRRLIEKEIAEYRTDPQAAMAAALAAASKTSTLTGAKERFANLRGMLDKLDPWQERLRQWYNNALDRLLWDIRIFSGTNIIAGLLAFVMAWASPRVTIVRLLAGSLVLLFSLAFCTWVYIDSFSLWTFVFRSSVEWWYPSAVALIFFRLGLKPTLRQSGAPPTTKRGR